MEYTEIETAKLLTSNSVFIANIESNNGGRGFARNVERNIRNLGNKKTTIHTFTQSLNKQVRIFTHSAEVQNMIYFPSDWERRWADFARDIKSHRKEGRNAHDDAPDVLTGMVEFFGSGLSRISDDQIADDFS
jgi:predicted phage terminase large subunit-like protein